MVSEGELKMTDMTIKVNTNTFKEQLNELDLHYMAPTEMETYIRENIQVSKLVSHDGIRFYVSLKEDSDS